MDSKKRKERDGSISIIDPKAKHRKINSSKKRILIRDDTEFAPDDYDGRIRRCEERIRAGYATAAFQAQLERLKEAKELHS